MLEDDNMFAELRMELKAENLNYRKSSNLQGVIMEHIDEGYAEELHRKSVNPYSQFFIKEQDKLYWYIRTLDNEAYEKILLPISLLEKFEIKNGSIQVEIVKKSMTAFSEENLLNEFYTEDMPKYLEIEFLTPTAFKQRGKYIFYPDLQLIYGSLMRKYSAISEQFEMNDEETLQQLIEHSEIVRYRLQTKRFPMEGIEITGFTGTICIAVRGPETMARYLRMLFRFGKYSGVGIKTAVGMGAILVKGGENT